MKIKTLIFSIVLTSCAGSPFFGERFNTIGPGMSGEELKAKLGNPDSYEKSGDYELYQYTDRMVSGWGWDKGNYFVVLNGNKVEKYGIGSMRYREWVPATPPSRTDVYIYKP